MPDLKEWQTPSNAQKLSDRTVFRFQQIANLLKQNLQSLPGFGSLHSVLFVQRDWKHSKRKEEGRFYNANFCSTYRLDHEELAGVVSELKTAHENANPDCVTAQELAALFGAYGDITEQTAHHANFIKALKANTLGKAHGILIEAASAIPYQGELPTAFDALSGDCPEGYWFAKKERQWKYKTVSTPDETPLSVSDLTFSNPISPANSEILKEFFKKFLNPLLLGRPPEPVPPSYPEHEGALHGLGFPCYEETKDDGFSGAFLGWLFFMLESPEALVALKDSRHAFRFAVNHFADRILEATIDEILGEYDPSHLTPDQAFKHYFERVEGWEIDGQSGKELLLPRSGKDGLSIKIKPKWDTRATGTQLSDSLLMRCHRLYRGLTFVFENSQVEALTKNRQMFDLLEPPLRSISKALEKMQSDTQELRAVLYEPEEALFASYTLIEPLFRGNHIINFSGANLPEIRVEHSPEQYDCNTIPLVAAKVACAIFGIDSQLNEEHDRNRVLSKAVAELKRVMRQTAHKEIANDFTWLTKCENCSVHPGSPTPRQLSEILEDCCTRECTEDEKGALAVALTRIKACLFTPFKVDSFSWPQAPLQLLVRHPALRLAVLSINGSTVTSEDPPNSSNLEGATGNRFPGSFANLLTFIRDFASGAVKANNARVTKIHYIKEGTTRRFLLQFDSLPDLNVQNARKQIEAVIRDLKDWRVEGSNYGDITGAFVRFANRLPGIGKEWTPDLTLDDGCTLISLEKVRTKVHFQLRFVPSERHLIIESNELNK